MPPQQVPFVVAAMEHAPPAYMYPGHHYPQQLHAPMPYPVTTMAAPNYIYPMQHNSHSHTDSAYPAVHAYSSTPPHHHPPYYGDTNGSLMSAYPSGSTVPVVMPQDSRYMPGSTHCSNCHGNVQAHGAHGASATSYSAHGAHLQGLASPRNLFMTSDMASSHNYPSSAASDSPSGRDSSGTFLLLLLVYLNED